MTDTTKEQEANEQSSEFSDYFNDGYNLAKNNPDMFAKVLADIGEDSSQAKGFLWGKWMYDNEQETKRKKKEQKTLSGLKALRMGAREPELDKNKPGSKNELTGLRAWIDELKHPMREAQVMGKGDSDKDETERDYE